MRTPPLADKQVPARTPRSCPICRVVDTQPEFPAPRGPAREHPLVRCLRCGLVFQEFLPTDEEIEEAQRNAYGAPLRRFSGAVEGGIRLFRSARVRLAASLMPEKGRVLDVGCGRGIFLRMLQERGYEVRGTELSPSTAAYAHPEVPVDVGELVPGRYPDESFDLVCMWHVLEHLRHPDLALEACARALKPGGALLLAVPNYASIQARLGGEYWFHLDLPRHVFQFTAATLRRLVESHGLDFRLVRTGQWEMDPFGLLQTVLNRLGFRHNALYDTLRNNEEVKRDLSRPYRVLMYVIFPFGMALAVPFSLLFMMLGRGVTLIAVARKPVQAASLPSESGRKTLPRSDSSGHPIR